MEQTKQIIHSNSSNIAKQCEILTQLLHNITQSDKTNVANTLAAPTTDFSEHAKHLQSVNTFQCSLLSKLCQTIVDFEVATLSCPSSPAPEPPKQPDTKEHAADTSTVDMSIDTIKEYVRNISLSPEAPRATILDKIKAYVKSEVSEVVSVIPEHGFKASGLCMSDLAGKSKSASEGGPFEYKEKSVPKKDEKCVMSHMQSPLEFYVHMVDEESAQLDDLGDSIRVLYENKPYAVASKSLTRDELGNCCVAYVDADDMWYRVQILDWILDDEDEDVLVACVDYGQTCRVPYRNFRPLDVQLAALPKLAVRCHMPYLVPPRNLDEWPSDSINGFRSILSTDWNQQYTITYAKEEDIRGNNSNSVSVDLVDKTGSSLAQILVDRELAAIDGELSEIEDVIANPVMVGQILSANGLHGVPTMSVDEKLHRFLMNTDAIDKTTNVNEAVGNYDPTDEARTCRFGPDCRKRTCRLEHKPLTDTFTSDKVLTYMKALNELRLPRSGAEVCVLITCVCDVGRFYARIVGEDQGLDGLGEVMNRPANVKKYEEFKLLPALSEVVLAKSWDGRWCRAQVRDLKGGEREEDVVVQVWAVDHGECVDVRLKDLRQIQENYLHLPFQAVECRLFNVSPNENISEEQEREVHDEFETRYACKKLKAKVVANVGYLEVLVFDENGEDIGETLVRDGMAVKRSEHFFPSSELLLVD